jgi:hypothetical protein
MVMSGDPLAGGQQGVKNTLSWQALNGLREHHRAKPDCFKGYFQAVSKGFETASRMLGGRGISPSQG